MGSSEPYHEGSRALQDRFDTRRLADRGAELMFGPGRGRPEARSRAEEGSRPRAADPRPTRAARRASCACSTSAPLAIPDYDGNGFFDSWGNVAVNPHVDLLFVDFEATRIYPVCPRYVHQLRIVRRSRFVPDEGGAPTPVAQWKLDATEVPPELLAADDPSRRESERLRDGGAPQPPTHGPFPG